jgi:hypothetical protein
LIKVGVVPLFFIIDVSHSCWNLIKFGYKIYDNHKLNIHLSNLPDYIASTSEEKKEEITCYICFDELNVGKRLNCGHVFHLHCIKDWVESSAGCPLCKVPVTKEKKTLRQGNEEFPQDNFNVDQGGDNINNINIDQDKNNINLNAPGQSTQQGSNKIHSDLKKFKLYEEIGRISALGDLNSYANTSSVPTGAVTYSLPTAAVYNRTVHNETKRLEIENYNRKILEIYENPFSTMNRSWENK